jgi:dTMP kinase
MRFAVGDLRPDLTFLIDLPVEDGLRRKQADEITRFEERADVEFHRRVRDGFLALAAAEPGRFVVIDGSQTADAIEVAIFEALLPQLSRHDELTPRNAEYAANASLPLVSEPERGSLRMEK